MGRQFRYILYCVSQTSTWDIKHKVVQTVPPGQFIEDLELQNGWASEHLALKYYCALCLRACVFRGNIEEMARPDSVGNGLHAKAGWNP